MAEEKTKQQREAAETLAAAQKAHDEAKAAHDTLDAEIGSEDFDPTSDEGKKTRAKFAEAVKTLTKAEQALEAAREDAQYVDRWTERRQAEINRIVAKNPKWANDDNFWQNTVGPIVADVKKDKFPNGMKESDLGMWADEIERRVNEKLAASGKSKGDDEDKPKPKPKGEDDVDPGDLGEGGADGDDLNKSEKVLAEFTKVMEASHETINPLSNMPSNDDLHKYVRGAMEVAVSDEKAHEEGAEGLGGLKDLGR